MTKNRKWRKISFFSEKLEFLKKKIEKFPFLPLFVAEINILRLAGAPSTRFQKYDASDQFQTIVNRFLKLEWRFFEFSTLDPFYPMIFTKNKIHALAGAPGTRFYNYGSKIWNFWNLENSGISKISLTLKYQKILEKSQKNMIAQRQKNDNFHGTSRVKKPLEFIFLMFANTFVKQYNNNSLCFISQRRKRGKKNICCKRTLVYSPNTLLPHPPRRWWWMRSLVNK